MIQYFNKSDFPGEMNRRIDGYDVRNYISKDFDVAFLGDVFMQGHGSRSFDPCTYHVINEKLQETLSDFVYVCVCVCLSLCVCWGFCLNVCMHSQSRQTLWAR